MRSYHDAKILAQSLRHALLDKKNVYIGQSESLEIVSNMFGLRDWNTLSAKIKTSQITDVKNPRGISSLQDTTPGIEPAFEPQIYEGAYRMESGLITNVFLSGNSLSAQRYCQPPISLSYSGSDIFVNKRHGIRLKFYKDITGIIAGHTSSQGGEETDWKRITSQEAAEIETSIRLRVSQNVPAQNSEKMLRYLIEGLVNGNLDYELLGVELARAVREQIEFTTNCLLAAGKLKSVTFIGVQDDGADTFHVRHEHRLFRWAISLDAEARKIILAWFISGG